MSEAAVLADHLRCGIEESHEILPGVEPVAEAGSPARPEMPAVPDCSVRRIPQLIQDPRDRPTHGADLPVCEERRQEGSHLLICRIIIGAGQEHGIDIAGCGLPISTDVDVAPGVAGGGLPETTLQCVKGLAELQPFA